MATKTAKCTVLGQGGSIGSLNNSTRTIISGGIATIGFQVPVIGVSKSIKIELICAASGSDLNNAGVVMQLYSEDETLTSGSCTSGITMNDDGAACFSGTLYTSELKSNTTYYIYLQGIDDGEDWSVTLWTPDSHVITVVYEDSFVYIDNGTELLPYQCYIDNGTGWDLYCPYIDTGSDWVLAH